MEFKDKLQQLRKQRGLTQEALAQALYVSRTAVSKWESGRGYPSIESLKAISSLFGITVDDLLSNAELLSLAETEGQVKVKSLRDMLFGLMDCFLATLFFFPIFGQHAGDRVLSVPLFALTHRQGYIMFTYYAFLSVAAVFGILELALQNCEGRFWVKRKLAVSLLLGAFGTLIFIATAQPYAATLVFLLLLIKGFLLIKQR